MRTKIFFPAHTKKIKLLLSILLLFQINVTAAQNNYSTVLPLNPRFIGDLSASRIGIGSGDLLVPLYGNRAQILYLDTQNNYGTDQSWMGSLGLGFRSTINNQLWGIYLFGDHDNDGDGGHFWVVNPGLEVMSNHWDAHVNAYFPTNNKKQLTDLTFGNQLGIYNFLRFQQHSEFDHLFAQYSIVGNGVDGEIGYSIPMLGNRARAYLGGYHYLPKEITDINGIQAGLEVPVNQYFSVKADASHDNVFGYLGRLSLRLELGGIKQLRNYTVQQRILDPVLRHEGTLATASGIISQKKLLNTGREGLVYDNIWFFTPGTSTLSNVTAADCTYEHPCAGINTNVINSINGIRQNAWLFLAPGTYANSTLGTGYSLNVGQSIFGRTMNYVQPAQGDQRALLNDTLFLNGSNLVANLQVNGQSDVSSQRVGIAINPTAIGTVQINNSSVTAITADINHDTIGILNASQNAMVLIVNSTANALTSGTNSNAIGLLNKGNNTILNSIISANSAAFAAGIFNEDIAHMNLINSTVIANANAVTPSFAAGIFNEDFASINIFNSRISANSSTLAKGINNEDFGLININASYINANATTLAEGISNEDFGRINIVNSLINASSPTQAIGIANEDFGLINVVNSIIIAQSPVQAIGISNIDFGRVNLYNSVVIQS